MAERSAPAAPRRSLRQQWDALLETARAAELMADRAATLARQYRQWVEAQRESRSSGIATGRVDAKSLVARRRALGLILRDVARESGYSASYVNQIERGVQDSIAARSHLGRTLTRLERAKTISTGD